MIKQLLSSVVAALVAAAASGQQIPPGTSVAVTYDASAATPAAQLALANRLRREVYKASSDQDRMKAVGTVVAHLEVIPRKWPNATKSIIESYLLQAEVLKSTNLYPNAQAVLLRAELLARGTVVAPVVYRELGIAHAALRKHEHARKAFAAAERSPGFTQLADVEKLKTLNAIALFYTRVDKQPREAAKRLRVAASLPSLDDLTAAGYLLRVVEQSKAVDRDEARRDLAQLENRFRAATTPAHPAAIDARKMIEGQITRLRAELTP